MSTPVDPCITADGGPTQMHTSPTTDAGIPSINTFGTPGPMMGPPTCGIGTTAGVCIGQM
jgi:hypothetical protein